MGRIIIEIDRSLELLHTTNQFSLSDRSMINEFLGNHKQTGRLRYKVRLVLMI
jgi:hypothetical protein